MSNIIVITEDLHGARLDRALSTLLPDISRSRLKALIDAGEVTLDKTVIGTPSHKVKTGQKVTLTVPDAEPAEPEAQDIPLDIVYEDDDLIVLNKPAGLVVHPAAGHNDGTLVNALLHHCAESLSGIGGVKRPGIVHRLDKDTSGLMLVAKNDIAHAGLSAQLADRTMSRTYHALVWGVPVPSRGRIDAALERHPRDRLRMSVQAHGRQSATNYKVIENFGIASLVECKLESGRTHQIRVHMAYKKCNVVGDPLYGMQKTAIDAALRRGEVEGKKADLIRTFPRQALHAVALEFVHPRTGKVKKYESKLPKDIKDLIKSFGPAK